MFRARLFVGLLSAVFFILLTVAIANRSSSSFVNPLGRFVPTPTPTPKPFLKYAFTTLKNATYQGSALALGEVMDDTDPAFTARLFTYVTDGKKMSGQINIPTAPPPTGGYPVIVMIRGFVDASMYSTGMGTKNGAAYLARHGYVTIAPDFLGYGQSDPPLADSIGARLEKPKHVIDLLASLPSLSLINPQRLGLWAHSNGGQIVLSVLEITGRPLPTVLWAPVSKSFPYSVLYYTDESADQGKALRKSVADFESLYNTFDYSIDRYWDWLQAPLEIHQGTADDAVPVDWSNELVTTLKQLDKDVTYFTYPGADHNLRPGWDTVIGRTLEFYNTHLLH